MIPHCPAEAWSIHHVSYKERKFCGFSVFRCTLGWSEHQLKVPVKNKYWEFKSSSSLKDPMKKNFLLWACSKTGFPGGPGVKNSPANTADMDSIPGSATSPGKGSSNPVQYSCLGNPMDRGPCRATVHGVPKELDTT